MKHGQIQSQCQQFPLSLIRNLSRCTKADPDTWVIKINFSVPCQHKSTKWSCKVVCKNTKFRILIHQRCLSYPEEKHKEIRNKGLSTTKIQNKINNTPMKIQTMREKQIQLSNQRLRTKIIPAIAEDDDLEQSSVWFQHDEQLLFNKNCAHIQKWKPVSCFLDSGFFEYLKYTSWLFFNVLLLLMLFSSSFLGFTFPIIISL